MTEISTAFATPVTPGTLDTADNIAGQITVTTASTPVNGPDVAGMRGFLVTPKYNSGAIWVIPHAGSKTTQAYPVGYGIQAFLNVADLNQCDFDATTSAQVVCWLKQ